MLRTIAVILTGENTSLTTALRSSGIALDDFTAKATASGVQLDALWTKIGKGAVEAGIVVAAVSVKMASDFEAAMLRIQTQAGATTQEVTQMSAAVLKLGPAVGETPKALAQALYYVESAGIRGADALNVLKLASEGAQVSGANLTDVTKALVFAMSSGVPGITSAHDAISQLNAVVGAGVLTMADLSKAMASGILTTGKEFGVTFQSMGAALDVMTSAGVPAEQATTRLRQGITLMAAPTTQAVKVLSAMGISTGEVQTSVNAASEALAKAGVKTTQLADDLRKPDGILVAVSDMKAHMDALGISATDQVDVISRAFGGGRMGQAIAQSFTNIDELRAKFDQIGASAGNFDQSWAATEHTFRFQVDAIKASLESWGVSLGSALIPKIQDAISFTERHSQAAKDLAEVIGGALVAAGLRWITVQADAFAATVVANISAMASGIQAVGAAFTSATTGLGTFAAGLAVVGGVLAVVGGAYLLFQHYRDQDNAAIAKASEANQSWAASTVESFGTGADAASKYQAEIASLEQEIRRQLSNGDSRAAIADTIGKLSDLKAAYDNSKTSTDQATQAAQAHGQSMHDAAAAIGLTDAELKQLTSDNLAAAQAMQQFVTQAENVATAAFSKSTSAVEYFSKSQIQSRASAAASAVKAADTTVNADNRVADAEQHVTDLQQQYAEAAATAKENYAAKVDANNVQIAQSEEALANTISDNNDRVVAADQKLADDRISLAQSVADAQRRLEDDRQSGAQSIADAQQKLSDEEARQALSRNPAALRRLNDQIQLRDAHEAVGKAQASAADKERADLESLGKAQEKQIETLAADQAAADKARVTQSREVEKAEAALTKDRVAQNKLAEDGLTIGQETLQQQAAMRKAVEAIGTAQRAVAADAARSAVANAKAVDSVGTAVDVTVADVKKFYEDSLAQGQAFADNIETAIKMGYNPNTIAELLKKGPEQAAPFLAAMVGDQGATMETLVNNAQTKTDQMNFHIREAARITAIAVKDSTDQADRDFDAGMKIMEAEAASGGSLTGQALADQLGMKVADVDRIAKEFGITLVNGINPVLAGIGVNNIAYDPGKPLTYDPASYTYRAAGGMIPGTGSGDIVPAMLEPGEFVVRKDVVAGMGADYFHAINAQHFAVGGFVSASDVPPVPDYSAYGTALGYGADQADQYARAKVIAYLNGSKGSSSGPPVGRPSGQVADWVAAGVELAGYPSWWDAPEVNIAMFESGGDPNAINNWDSNAQAGTPSKGLMQVIDPTFRAYMVPNHGDIWNPIDNVAAASNYIAARYGNPSNTPGEVSLARGGSYQGYEFGGLVEALGGLHVGSYDSGGFLEPGWNLGWNGLGAREPVGAMAGPAIDYDRIGKAVAQYLAPMVGGDINVSNIIQGSVLGSHEQLADRIAEPLRAIAKERGRGVVGGYFG